jgi:hypothetical protein
MHKMETDAGERIEVAVTRGGVSRPQCVVLGSKKLRIISARVNPPVPPAGK